MISRRPGAAKKATQGGIGFVEAHPVAQLDQFMGCCKSGDTGSENGYGFR